MKTKVVAKVFIRNEDDKYLLLLRGSTAPRRPLQWDLPGGIAEAEEKAEDAATREVNEETGLRVEQLQLIYAQTFFWEHEGLKENVIWLYYTAKSNITSVQISWEHDEYKWVTIDDLPNCIEYDKQLAAIKHLAELSS